MQELRAPQIYFYELPREEQKVGCAIVDNLRALQQYRETFRTDLELFDFAYDNMKSGERDKSANGFSWMFIAARDGAMMLYHFGMTLRAFGGLLRRAPTLAALVDTQAVEKAKQAFEDHFKDFYQIRQAVAHLADHSVTPDRRARHATKKSGKFIYIAGPRGEDGNIAEGPAIYARNVFHERTFWGTVEGEPVEYDVTEESLEKLCEVERVIYPAFRRARDETMRRHMKRQLSPQPPTSG